MPTPESPDQALLVHDGFVRALARSLLRDPQAAEDVAQDTWVTALEHGAAAVSLPRWLAGVVRKRAGKHARAQERRARRERDAARGESTPSGAEILEREALRARVVAAVLALEEPYRECVLLRFFEGLPPRAIAARLGVPVETVRTRLKRALERLRARLDRECGGREAWSLALAPWALPSGSAAGGSGLPALVLGLGGLALVAVLLVRGLGGSPETASAIAASPGAVAREERLAAPAAPPTRVALRPESVPEPVTAEAVTTEVGSLRLAVRWSDGTPAAGIHARFESFHVDSPFFRARRGVTDEAGALRLVGLPPGSGSLTLDRNSGASVAIEAGEEATLELVLPRGFDVEGLVVDREGRPVGGAELWLSDVNAFTGSFVGTADAGGRFALRSCARGSELGAFAPGHAPSLLASLAGEEGTRVSVRLVLLGPGGEVSGRVRDPRGEPVAGAQLLVGSEQHSFERVFVEGEGELVGTVAPARLVFTDAEGRFRARGVAPGRVPIAARAEGYALARCEVTLEAVVGAEAAVELTLEPEASLVGRVLDDRGAPLAKAWVKVLSRFGLLDPGVTTAEDGVYRLGGLAPGRQALEVLVHGAGSARATFELVAGEEREWDPVVGLGLTLAGRVLDENGVPLAGWGVEVNSWPGHEPSSNGSARTDAEGRFLVKSLSDEPHRLALEAPGSSLASLELVGLRPGAEDLVLHVPASRMPSARVRGTVVRADGTVPANLGLELATSGFGLPGEADAQGRFDLGPFVPGRFVLFVRAQGEAEHVLGPRRLGPGEVWDLGRVVLEPAGSVVVRAIRAPDTDALEPWFRLSRVSEDGSFDLGRVEAAGPDWRRVGLAPGRYALEVGGNGVAAARVPFTLRPGEPHVLEVAPRPGLRREVWLRVGSDLGSGRLPVALSDESGVVLEDELWPRSPGDYRMFLTLAPGPYRLVAGWSEGPRGEAELRVVPEEFAPFVVELR